MPSTLNNRWRSWLRYIAWRRVGIAIGMALVLAVLVLSLGTLIPAPQTVTVIKAQSEILEYRVFNPELALIQTGGFRFAAWPDGSRDDQCALGSVKPGALSTVSYQRVEAGPFVITLNGRGTFQPETGDPVAFDGETILVPDDALCGKPATTRLPVWGPGTIGATYAVRSDGNGPILLSGTLEVFGRTIDTGLISGGALYLTTPDPINIPPASSIRSDEDGAGDEALAPALTALFGYVALTDEPGFAVQLTTETSRLGLTTPGASETASRIEVGLFAQALNDPNILAIQILLVLFVVLLPICIDMVNLALSRSDEDSSTHAQIPPPEAIDDPA